jgi:hypothetical protein
VAFVSTEGDETTRRGAVPLSRKLSGRSSRSILGISDGSFAESFVGLLVKDLDIGRGESAFERARARRIAKAVLPDVHRSFQKVD